MYQMSKSYQSAGNILSLLSAAFGIISIAIGATGGVVAKSKGRGVAGWVIGCLFLSPICPAILLLLRSKAEASAPQEGARVSAEAGAPADGAGRGAGGLELRTGFMPLAFFLYFCKPVIRIDGVENPRRWGTSLFELPAGTHRVAVFVPYLFLPHCGLAETSVDIAPGSLKRLSFFMPPVVTAKGTLKTV
jgi:hypothetical protein